MVKMAIFDIDNTLYSHKTETLPSSAKKAVELLREKGIVITVASGREIKDDVIMAKIINSVHPDYYITANGQGLYDKDCESIYSHHLDNDSIDKLIEECKEKRNEMYLKFASGMYLYSFASRDISEYKRGYPNIINCPSLDHHYKEECIGGSFMAKHDDATLRSREEMEKDYPNVHFIDIGGCYEMTTKGVNKLVTIKDLCSRLGITLNEVIAFGDSGNDVEILQNAGISVAMGDGQKVAKDVANYITDGADDNGIYNACVHFKLI